jgi:hypothetical protein
MDRDEMITDAVDRLDAAVRRLELLVDGDESLGLRGLTQRLSALENEVRAQQNMRAGALQWLIGYVLFGLFSFSIARVGIEAMQVPLYLAAGASLLLFLLSAFFFVSGLGWLKLR